ncbi:MAG: hypothetical protein R6X06_04850 [Gammaproteobacteria bacterium]
MLKKIVLVLLVIVSVTACQEEVATSPKPAMVLFAEQEINVDPYQTRIIVNEDYMRMDEGNDTNDFVLLDRKAGTIYSVNSENKTVMSVTTREVDIEPPMQLSYSEDKVKSMQNAPAIDGKTPEHYAFSVNGKVCYEAILVKDMLPDMVKAMQDFSLILAGDSAVTFNAIPADMHNACDMAGSTFAPSRHLRFGFPVQEWKEGYSRTLMEYDQDYSIDPALFELPGDYFQFSVQDYREGKVQLPE